MAIQSINPATEEVLETFDEFSPGQMDAALQQVYDRQKQWRTTSFAERAAGLHALAAALRADKARFAGTITAEMGKPIVEAEAEIEKCAWNCDFYADNAQRFLTPEHIDIGVTESYVAFEPLGVVLAIMPWNFPFWQVIRFLAPALMAGNTAVLKHASNVPRCGAGHRGGRPAGRPARGRVPGAAGARRLDRAADRRSARRRDHPDRLQRGRRARRQPGREPPQEAGAGAWRLRPVRRPGRCRPGRGGEDGRPRPQPEQRPELHRGEALHRRGGVSPTSSSPSSPLPSRR